MATNQYDTQTYPHSPAGKIPMTTTEFFQAIAGLSGLLFIVTSMLAMGMSLTMPQIIEPLKNGRLVALALLANFVLVPLVAYVIILVIPLEQDLQIGLLVLASQPARRSCPSLCRARKAISPSESG